jgi:hypothetical protein
LSFFFFSCSSDSEIIEEVPITTVNYYSSGKLVENNNISAWFDRSLDVYSIRLHAAGAVGGQLAVPDEWIKKTAQTFKLLIAKNATGINAENKPSQPNKELSRLFPNVMMWVNAIKEESGHEEVSHLGQSAEANIFVEVYKEIPNEKFALIIHDCILTTKKDVLLVKNLLENRVRKLFSGVILEHYNLDKFSFNTRRAA